MRTPYDIALAKGEFELAEVLEGNMTAAEAREFYMQKIAALYGVGAFKFSSFHYSSLFYLTGNFERLSLAFAL